MFIYCICTQYLVGAPFALITVSIRRGMEVISLWHCWGGMKAHVSLTVAFRSSALVDWKQSQILYGAQVWRVCWPIKHSSTMVIEPAFGTFGSVGRCQVLLEKWNQHLHKACQQKEAWSALKFPGRWPCNHGLQKTQWTNTSRWHGSPNHHWLENSHWTSSNMDAVPLLSSSRLWDLDFQMKCKIYFHLKRGLWTTEQQSSSLSP